MDQAVKVVHQAAFRLAEKVTWIPGAFDIQFIENDGMAFGWAFLALRAKYLLTAFRIVAVVLAVHSLSQVKPEGAPGDSARPWL